MKSKPSKRERLKAEISKATIPKQLSLADLIPDDRNANRGTERGHGLLEQSLQRLGAGRSILVDKNNRIVAGNKTHEVAAGMGLNAHVVEVSGDTVVVVKRTDIDIDSPEGRELAIADNRVGEANLNWDTTELDAFAAQGVKVSDYFFPDELKKLREEVEEAATVEETNTTVETTTPASRFGDVWLLGRHRVMCGDSRDVESVALLMDGKRASLIHADPPYGMGKEADGVANDNLYGDKLDAFQMAWWRAFRAHTADNGSAYIWGRAPELWRLWYRSDGLEASEPLSLRNEIVWDKKTIPGMASGDLGQYPEASERCLFFQIGRHIFMINRSKEDYWRGWDPIRLWMIGERDKMKWKAGDVKKIVGNHMYGHWFGDSQWAFISADNYAKLREAAKGQAFTRDYEELRAEYHALQRVFNGEVRDPKFEQFSAARPYFDNAHDVMRDVWEFGRVTGEERGGHATPKPVAMMERIVTSSSREGEVVIEPFGGTGPTLIACENTGRVGHIMELEPVYVDYMVERWQKLTGQAATLLGDGRTFEDVRKTRLSPPEPEEEETAPTAAKPQELVQ